MLFTRREALQGMAGALAIALAGCDAGGAADGDATVQRSFFCFDTVCSMSGVMPQDLLDLAVERCEFFERTLSRTVEGSDVWNVNHAGGAPVEVEPTTAALVKAALDYSARSGGLFDITIGAVSQLWDFHEGIVPDASDIEAALPHVGWERVRVDGTSVALDDPQAAIDLGGIAKGFIADDLVRLLREGGATSAIVNLGGNVCVMGGKPDGGPWAVGVRDPREGAADDAVLAVTHVTDGSVVTSGLYERQFEAGGRRWWHILDPRTGYPVESDLVSVSVLSDISLDGDGLTKPPFMLGVEDGLAFLEEAGVEGLLVDSLGKVHLSAGASFELR